MEVFGEVSGNGRVCKAGSKAKGKIQMLSRIKKI